MLKFCPFAVIGDPTHKKSLERVREYVAQADMLELGIPFSDPPADGPIIQAADQRSLKNGMTTTKALKFCKEVRSKTEIPVGILVYANIVFKYGIDKFYRDAKSSGVTSVLVADLPLEESAEYVKAAKKHKIQPIFIVSENTTTPRLKKILKHAQGFLYVVSTLGITGTRKSLPKTLPTLLKRLRKHTKLPLIVGFGISTPEQVKSLKKMKADGFIVGSALIKCPTREYFLSLLNSR